MLKEDKEMQIDRERLANVCCAPQPVKIQGVLRSGKAVAKRESENDIVGSQV
jgi:hypothetical protein